MTESQHTQWARYLDATTERLDRTRAIGGISPTP
jgi:hypothetical protein